MLKLLLSKKLIEVIVEKWSLPLKNLLALESDGPNVSKAILKEVNKYLVEAKLPKLVDIGSCNLHVVHNGFGKGFGVF